MLYLRDGDKKKRRSTTKKGKEKFLFPSSSYCQTLTKFGIIKDTFHCCLSIHVLKNGSSISYTSVLITYPSFMSFFNEL